MTPMPLLALAAALSYAQTPAPSRSSIWLVPWDELSAGAIGGCVSEINPFVYAFDSKYKPFLAYPALLARVLQARPQGARIVPVIVNDVLEKGGSRMKDAKSIELLTRILNSDKLAAKHVEELLKTASTDNVDGLEIDYERIPPALYGRFSGFIEKLAAELHRRGKVLSVDLEAGPLVIDKEREIALNQWPRIAAAADEVKLMMYYERGDFSDNVGPGSSLAWVAENGRKALAFIPAAKLTLALSLSGTDWQTPFPESKRADRLHYGQVMELARKTGAPVSWNPEWASPVFRYSNPGGAQHEVWFEDERSLAAKVQAADQLGAGVALWYLGAEHPDVSRLGLCRR